MLYKSDKSLSDTSQFFLQNAKRDISSPHNKACSVVLETKTNCLICEKDFPSFYSLQRHKKSEHGKLSRNLDLTVDLELIMGDYLDRKLREELRDCQHFLVDYEFVGGRLHVFKFPSTIGTPSFLKDK